MATRRCVIYARISVSNEASVSIERQVQAAEQYAASRGWKVVGTFRDDGVSATYNEPKRRVGWRALLDFTEKYDAVVIWKVDRLARKTIDFLLAEQALEARGAGIVAVEDPIDMTTAQGRAFATMLAVFAQLESDTIRARVKAARAHLLRSGRVAGGAQPYGWHAVANPDGPGYVVAQDPEHIEYVVGMVDRVVQGDSLYSVLKWLDEVGAPLPRTHQSQRKRDGWAYSTVERLLRNPILAGMTAFNPGNASHTRGDDVLRDDADGLPVVDDSVAILTPAEWRSLVRILDERDTPQTMPRAMRAKTSGLLSGLLVCAEHGDKAPRMWRGTVQGRASYYCRECHAVISNFEEVVIEEFLRQKGERTRWSVVEETHEGGAALLPEIEQRLNELDKAIRDAAGRDERLRLQLQQSNLLDLRDEKRAQAPAVTLRPVRHTQTFGEDWAFAEDVAERRLVLDDAVKRIWVARGGVGQRSKEAKLARLSFEWHMPNELGTLEQPDDATLAEWADDNPVPRRHPKRQKR